MKYGFLNLIIAGLIGLANTSCTKDAFLELDPQPVTITALREAPMAARLQSTSKLPGSKLVQRDTTISLQVIRATLSATTGQLVMYFAGSGDLSQLKIHEEQNLIFNHPDGRVLSKTLPVLDFFVAEELLQVEFGIGREYDDALEPEGDQSIIVVDVIVN